MVCPSFLWARLASVEWSVTSCAPSRSSLFEPCFQKQGTSVSEVECCSLALPILFQRYLRCRPWSVKPFEKYSISDLWRHTINAISMYRSVGHDCKWLRLPKYQSLILRFWQSYPENCILARFPTSNIRHFLWKCVIIMRPFFLRVISKKDSLVSETLPDGLYLSPSLSESVHFLIWNGKFHERPLWNMYFSYFEELIHNQSILAGLEYRHNVLE